jgi:exodeoxyribonuclease VIII
MSEAYAAYCALPGVRWSRLSHILDSPAHYLEYLEREDTDTPARAIGRAVHALALDPVAFQRDFACWESGRRAGQEWLAFATANRHKTILRPDDFVMASAMADAVKTSPLVTPYLTRGRFEVPIRWKDPATGLLCKGRVDWIQPGTRTLVELKTARSIEMYAFGSDARRYHYPGQLMFYAQGIAASLGWEPERIVIIAVEKSRPYDVGVFELDMGARQHGLSEVHEALERLAACERSEQWPGRYSVQQTLLMPHYATDDLDMGDLPEED